jgi:predicted dehydrogenase
MGSNHARVASELETVELVGSADPDARARSLFEKRYHLPTYAGPKEMFADLDPDAVCVAVPTRFHEQVAMEVISHGAHMLVEKPLALTTDSARRIVEEAGHRGVKVMAGHIERFNPAVQELRRRLRAGEIGRVVKVSARRLNPGPGRITDVGVVLDLATHDLDVVRFLLGSDPVRVYAETAAYTGTDREDVLSAVLRFPGDIIATLDVNWLTPTKVRQLAVTGERGMFIVDYLTQDLTFYKNDYQETTWQALQAFRGASEGESVRLKVNRREPLRVEWERFIECLQGELPAGDVDDGLGALALAEMVLRAAKEHAAISTPQEGRASLAAGKPAGTAS